MERKVDDSNFDLDLSQLVRSLSFRRLGRRDFIALVSAGLGATAVGTVGRRITRAAAAVPVPQGGGTLTFALVSVDDRFDPAATTYTSVVGILQHVTEPLIWELAPGKFFPGLAESWTVSPDAKVYTFKLKRGVKFHDGTPFTAEAVKFTLDRVVSPNMIAGQARGNLGPYDRTEIIDEFTARVVMKQGYAPMLTNLNGYLGIVSPTAVKNMGDAKFLLNPVGTGSFMWKEYVPNDHVTLVKNPDYNWGSSGFSHRGPAYLDQIVYKIIPQGSVRVGVLKTGEVQYIENVDPLAVEELKKDPKFEIIQKDQNGIPHSLLLHVGKRTDTGRPAVTAELAVRRAICFAVDREGLNKTVYRGTTRTAWNFLPPISWAYDETAAKMYSYDPGKARQILNEAGWKLGMDGVRSKGDRRLTVEIVFRANRDEARSESIQASLRAVGIDCKLTPLEVAAQRAAIRAGNYEGVYTWDPNGDPDALREIAYTGGVYNRSIYSNPQVDKWIDEAVSLTKEEERKPIYAKIQRKIMEDAIGVPFAHSFLVNGKRAEVIGDRVDGIGAVAILYDTWIRKS